MKRLSLVLGALLVLGTFVASSEAVEPIRAQTAIQVTRDGTPAVNTTWRRRARVDYRRGYYGYGPRYGAYYGGNYGSRYGGYNGYYGPRYSTGYRGVYGW